MGNGSQDSGLGEIWSKSLWFLVLLPGFLALMIATSISGLSVDDEFSLIFYSLILTFVIVAVNFTVLATLTWFTKWSIGPTTFLLGSLILALICGLALGYSMANDALYRVLRSVPILSSMNKRSDSRPLVFLLSQNSSGQMAVEGDARPEKQKQTEAWVQIVMSNGVVYEGWPEFYEIGTAETQIYLSPACETAAVTSSIAVPVPGPGVLVFEREIVSIRFVDRSTSICYKYWLG